MNTVIHLSGKLTLSGNGSAAQLYRIEIENPEGDDSAEIELGGTTLMYFYNYNSSNICGLNLNGHYLKIMTGSDYPTSVLFFCHRAIGNLKGPGAIYMDRRTGGIRAQNDSQNWFDGALNISDGLVVTANVEIARTASFGIDGSNAGFGVLRQKDSKIVVNRVAQFGGNKGGRPAYLLESGIFDASQYDLIVNGGNDPEKSAYLHFRQTGGDFSANRMMITNNAAGLNADFAFGTGTARIGSGGMHLLGDAAFSFNDNVKFSVAGGIGNLGGHHIWAYNGGTAESRFLTTDGFSRPDGDFFALNGGAIAYGHSSAGTASDLFGNNPEIRIYERGGEIAVDSNVRVDIDGVDFIAPRGNVLKSISMSSELRNQQFRTPPSVEITDATGSNAAAIVNYDLDTKKVTNITVVCRGENYTAPTANLHFRRGETLLSTPLTCTVGPEESGNFTFTTTNLGAQVWLLAHTNFTYGSVIVDMDPLGLVDGGFVDDSKYRYTNTDQDGFENTLVIKYYKTNLPVPRFENCTNIVLKSGGIHIWSSWGFDHDYVLPNCYSLEIYGGHIGGGTLAVTNLVIGGTAYLSGHNYQRGWGVGNGSSPYSTDLNVYGGTPKNPNVWRSMYNVCSSPGTLTIDVDSPSGPAVLKAGCVPGITANQPYDNMYVGGGSFRFGGSPSNPCTVTIKNYESLRGTKVRKTLLDLSDPYLVVAGTNNVNAVTPPDLADLGQIEWSPVARKLYWSPAGGLFLIFK